jgi:hypothetical protein
MTTEHGQVVEFTSYQEDGIVLGQGDRRAVYLNSSFDKSRNHLLQFVREKSNPGLIFISNRAYLHTGEFVHSLFSQGMFLPSNIIFLAQHNMSRAELDFADEKKLHFFPMREVSSEGCYEISESIMSIAKQFSDLYVYIDSGVLDYPIIRANSPGGLTTRELVYFIQRIKMMKNVMASEIILNPTESRIGVKLLSELYNK